MSPSEARNIEGTRETLSAANDTKSAEAPAQSPAQRSLGARSPDASGTGSHSSVSWFKMSRGNSFHAKSMSASWKKYWVKVSSIPASSTGPRADEQQLALSYHTANTSPVTIGVFLLDTNNAEAAPASLLMPAGDDTEEGR